METHGATPTSRLPTPLSTTPSSCAMRPNCRPCESACCERISHATARAPSYPRIATSPPDHNVRSKWQGELRSGISPRGGPLCHQLLWRNRRSGADPPGLHGVSLHLPWMSTAIRMGSLPRCSNRTPGRCLKPSPGAEKRAGRGPGRTGCVSSSSARVQVLYSSFGPTYRTRPILRPDIVPAVAAPAAIGELPFRMPKQIAG